ncbi:MAG: hypothetical protein AAGG11_18760 [Pseudomonadota bacterium]
MARTNQMRTFTDVLNTLISVLLLWCASSTAVGKTTLESVLESSGLKAQFSVDSEPAARLFAQGFGSALPPQLGEEITDITVRVIAGHDLYAFTKSALADKISPRNLRKLSTWFESDLGRKIVTNEVQHATPEAMERLAAQLNSLTADQSLMERARQLDVVLNIAANSARSVQITQTAVTEGILDARGASEEQKESALTEVRRGVDQGLEESMTLFVAMAGSPYRSLTHDEFERYLKFLRSKPAQQFHELITEASLEAVRIAYYDVGQHLGTFLQNAAREAATTQSGP